MADRENAAPGRDSGMPTVTISVVTWRYMGDRDAADRAYCVRFGVTSAPEPTIAVGGALAYPVPAGEWSAAADSLRRSERS